MKKIDIYIKEKDKSRRLYVKAKNEGNNALAEEHALDMFLLTQMIEIEQSKHIRELNMIAGVFAVIFAIAFVGMFFI